MPATSSVFRGHPFRVALWTLKGVALAHVGFTHVLSAAPGWGPSMLPTFLVDGQWFVVDRRCRRGRGVAVGDCVLYAIPVVSPGTTGGGTEGVKRVVGLPGDYVLLNSPGAKSEAMMQVSPPPLPHAPKPHFPPGHHQPPRQIPRISQEARISLTSGIRPSSLRAGTTRPLLHHGGQSAVVAR